MGFLLTCVPFKIWFINDTRILSRGFVNSCPFVSHKLFYKEPSLLIQILHLPGPVVEGLGAN